MYEARATSAVKRDNNAVSLLAKESYKPKSDFLSLVDFEALDEMDKDDILNEFRSLVEDQLLEREKWEEEVVTLKSLVLSLKSENADLKSDNSDLKIIGGDKDIIIKRLQNKMLSSNSSSNPTIVVSPA